MSEFRYDRAPDGESTLFALVRALFSGFGQAVVVKDEACRFLYANKPACELFGYDLDTLAGRRDRDFLPDPQADAITAIEQEILRSGEERTFEETVLSPGGGERKLLTHKHRIALPAPCSGQYLLIAVTTDATEQRRVEGALRESEEHYRSLVELHPQTPWTASPTGEVEEMGSTWRKILGRAPEGAIGSGWASSVHPDDLVDVQDAWKHSVTSGDPFDVECRLTTVDGTVRWVRSRAAPKRDADGSIIRWYGLVEDIHEKKQAEEALRESDSRFRMIADSVPVMLWISDADGDSTYQNKSWLDFTGQEKAAALKHGWLDAVHPEDRGQIMTTFLAASEARQSFRCEYRLRRADGSWAWVIDAAQPRLSANGEFLGYSGSVLDISDRRDTELALERSEASLRSIFDSSPDCLRLLDLDGTPIQMNRAGHAMFGLSPDAGPDDLRLEDRVSPADAEKLGEAIAAAGRGETVRIEAAVRDRRGSSRHMDVIAAPVPNHSGMPSRILTIWRDITETKAAKDQAEEARAVAETALSRLATVLEGTMDSVIVVDRRWNLTYTNAKARTLLKVGEEVIGRSLWDLFSRETSGGFGAHYEQALKTGQDVTFEDYLPLLNLWLEVHASPSEEGLSIFFRDISARRRAEQERLQAQSELLHMSRHDALTGLPNHVHLREYLEGELGELGAAGRLAVLTLDLEGFDEISDMYSHAAVDDLLYQAANRLKSCLSENGMLARLSGDDFVIVQPEIAGPDEALSLAHRIAHAFEDAFDLNETTAFVAPHIGMAFAPEHGDGADQLMKASDAALHRAKEAGSDRHSIYDASMDVELHERQRLKVDLRSALDRDEFEVFFQPLIELASDGISGCEALLRWRHADKGMVSPASFIPLAEDSGLIVEIGAMVLDKACREASRWPASTGVAVNLSPRQFKEGRALLQTVSQALSSSGIDPARLQLEITESVVLDANDANLQLLSELRRLGVKIAMDDFGTGYSSLGYLRSFPFDKIKVDRRFAADLPAGREALAILRAVAGIGRALGITTLIEGVETQAQLDVVRAEGFDEAQGFFFAPPMPAPQMREFLQERSRQSEDGGRMQLAKSRPAI